MQKRVLGVGHCSYDAPRIQRVIETLGGVFTNVQTEQDALDALKTNSYCLVLPNRVLAGDENGGVKLIRAIRDMPEGKTLTIMLVSAIPSAQEAAVSAGAVRGFGKDILESPELEELLQPFLS